MCTDAVYADCLQKGELFDRMENQFSPFSHRLLVCTSKHTSLVDVQAHYKQSALRIQVHYKHSAVHYEYITNMLYARQERRVHYHFWERVH